MTLTGFKKHPIYKDYGFSIKGECYSFKTNKMLKCSYNKQGYVRFGLYINGAVKTLSAHRLIAQTWIENKGNFRDVNHKNGVKDDNRVDNLEWCTHSYNVKHAFDNGLNKVSDYARKMTSIRNNKIMLENHPNKRAVSNFDLSLNKIKTFESIREASVYYSISAYAISNNLSGLSKTCNKMIWKYE